ncbi:MAG TPA: hypothetical protein VML19_28295 [Verrucomicrobiae bacterium]|nr:hypothetical protein [Verrucomicrobiae bacterium]
MVRCVAVCLLIAAVAQAGLISPIPISRLAEAPFVMVARVESTEAGPLVTVDPGWKRPTRRPSAVLRVLRSMPEFTGQRIHLNYYSTTGGIANGHPAFPSFETGKSYVLAVVPDGAQWKLLEEEGWGTVAPAVEAPPDGDVPATKRDFIVRELSNVTLHGSYADLYRFGGYLQLRQAGELNDEMFAALKAKLPAGDGRWLDVSTALLGTMGIPRQKLDEFVSAAGAKSGGPDAPANLAARTLREVPESQRREGIVRNMLRYSAVHEWGSAATLVPEFKDDPLLLELLPGYLERKQKGAVYIACWLVNNGQLALLESTQKAAMEVLADKSTDFNEISIASRLILEHGTDAQFAEFLRVFKEAKAQDAGRYNELWQVGFEGKPPRVVRILAVLLDDERPAAQGMSFRFCDYGASLLQKVSGESFGFKPGVEMSLEERNAGVARARAWVKAHPEGR